MRQKSKFCFPGVSAVGTFSFFTFESLSKGVKFTSFKKNFQFRQKKFQKSLSKGRKFYRYREPLIKSKQKSVHTNEKSHDVLNFDIAKIHWDSKPQNIFSSNRNICKLLSDAITSMRKYVYLRLFYDTLNIHTDPEFQHFLVSVENRL